MADKKDRRRLQCLVVYIVCSSISTAFRIEEGTCYRCTSADLPCKVELMSSCFLPMVGTKWPSNPRDLKAVAVRKDDCWAANFSWKAPYDSSISSLTGFKLTLNIAEDGGNVHIMGHPICIFLNLTSSKWDNWSDDEWNFEKHDITFYSECLCIRHPATVDLHITSYPYPPDPQTVLSADVRIELQGVQDYNVYEWNPWIRWQLKENSNSVDIEILFGPPFPEAAIYQICLEEKLSPGYCANETQIPTPNTAVIFQSIQCNRNYSIMIRPKGKKGEWLTDYYSVSEDFRVQVSTSEPVMLTMEPEDRGSTPAEIGVIVLITALVITVAISVFFIFRKDEFNIRQCLLGHQEYSLPMINQRNNNIADSEVSSIFLVHFPDDENHAKMAHAFYLFLHSVCKLNVINEHNYNDNHQQTFEDWIGDHCTDTIVLLLSMGLLRSYSEVSNDGNIPGSANKSQACCMTVLNYIKHKQLENQHVYMVSPTPELEPHTMSLKDLKCVDISLTSRSSSDKTTYLYTDDAMESFVSRLQQNGFNNKDSLQKDWKKTNEAKKLLESINDLRNSAAITCVGEQLESIDSGFYSEVILSNTDVVYTVTAPMLQDFRQKEIQHIGLNMPSHFIPPECDTSSIDSSLSQQIARFNERNGSKWDKC